MRAYLDLLERVMSHGEDRLDRTGTGTRSLFGCELRVPLDHGFPLLTTKKVNWKASAAEFIWMVRGEQNVKGLHEMGVHIWDQWADEDGDLGPVYGAQWRRWSPGKKRGMPPEGIQWESEREPHADQLAEAVEHIRIDPWSRRIVVSAWNVHDLPQMRLPPCHVLFQFYCGTDNSLSVRVDMRSVDMFLGMPFDICLYAFLAEHVAAITNRWAKMLIFHLGDTHVYKNHFDQVKEQLERYPMTPAAFSWNRVPSDLDHIVREDFQILGYQSWPTIKGDISV